MLCERSLRLRRCVHDLNPKLQTLNAVHDDMKSKQSGLLRWISEDLGPLSYLESTLWLCNLEDGPAQADDAVMQHTESTRCPDSTS